VALGTILGVVFTALAINPMKALFWSAVLNGVIAIPLMVIIMLISSKKSVMKTFVASSRVKWLGWTATAVMFAAFVGMMVTL
jgi:Mn2+/Fe2+ NRAMP family transporter